MDAAMFDDGSMRLGMVGRDSNGSVVVVSCKRDVRIRSMEEAEAKVVVVGLEVALRMGIEKVHIETDSLIVVNELNGRTPRRNYLGVLIDDIIHVLSSFVSSCCSHVKRGGNTVAHLCARLCTRRGNEVVYVTDFPQAILSLA
ncbi:uncharacterized protein LOC141617875 [Silene latifolia]|uniref:uncharacterized protein LOC141617875 n=1 Tax=Silene latifolia TaxID=37657 RepID=UPI003D77D6B1